MLFLCSRNLCFLVHPRMKVQGLQLIACIAGELPTAVAAAALTSMAMSRTPVHLCDFTEGAGKGHRVGTFEKHKLLALCNPTHDEVYTQERMLSPNRSNNLRRHPPLGPRCPTRHQHRPRRPRARPHLPYLQARQRSSCRSVVCSISMCRASRSRSQRVWIS